jgi:hypothetical protein
MQAVTVGRRFEVAFAESQIRAAEGILAVVSAARVDEDASTDVEGVYSEAISGDPGVE